MMSLNGIIIFQYIRGSFFFLFRFICFRYKVCIIDNLIDNNMSDRQRQIMLLLTTIIKSTNVMYEILIIHC
jgi:hypothetical protein